MKKRILIEAALLEFIAAAGCILVVDNWALGALLIVAGILFLFLSSRYKDEPVPRKKTKKKRAK
ncbi:MAG: hypothetical protein J6D36_00265 [Erysipelotrichaceae bacterium]|nr:hypothetical protein [Erysipelotrichaceae bacterium]